MTPRLAVVQTEQVRPGWDVRAWRFGLISSSVVGLTLALCFENVLQGWVDKHASGLRNVVTAVSFLLAVFVLPGILSGIARRRWLLWAYLPYAVVLFWMMAVAMIDAVFNTVDPSPAAPTSRHETLIVIAVLFVAPLVTALPVILVRLRRAANRSRRAAQLAFEEAQYTMERVGVWPPPPNPVVSEGDESGIVPINDKYK